MLTFDIHNHGSIRMISRYGTFCKGENSLNLILLAMNSFAKVLIRNLNRRVPAHVSAVQSVNPLV